MSLLLLLRGTESEGPSPEYSRVAVRQEYPPDRLAVRIDPPGGAPSRWAGDEHLTENVITDLRLLDEMPGGDKEMKCVQARDPRMSWPDHVPFSEVTVYGTGAESVWQGRLDKAPESDGDHLSISPVAVGWQATLDDNKAIVGPGFIDRDLSKFQAPSKATVIQWLGEGKSHFGPESHTDPAGGKPIIRLAVAEPWPSGARSAAMYDSGGVEIGEFRYSRSKAGGVGSFTWAARLLADDSLGSVVGADTGTIEGAVTDGSVSGTGGRFIELELANDEAKTASTETSDTWFDLCVLGDHGLSLLGEWPNVGFTVSQMLAHVIPLNTELEARPEDLEDLGYIIQQAWFSDPGPLSQVVQELTKYELLDWFVRGKRFFLKQPGTYGRRWQAYAGPSGLQEQGLDASRLWREILVTYQDVDGSTRTVGPPGSGAMVEDSGLEISDPDHPAVRAGVSRRDRLDLRGISTPARAVEAGEIWLREANRLSRSGSATLSDYAMDDRGVFRPVSQIRAGDEVRFPDAADPSYRKVVRRAYEDVTKTVSVDLDAPPEGLQALLERMQADIQNLAL